jgi:hypothetical protein
MENYCATTVHTHSSMRSSSANWGMGGAIYFLWTLSHLKRRASCSNSERVFQYSTDVAG